MEKSIDTKKLEQFEAEFAQNPVNYVAMNAAAGNGIVKAATNNDILRESRHSFSISLEQGAITNQKQSGRCWLFAAMNVMRFHIMKKLNLENLELSQNYMLFYDKLEKANYFLENILETLEESTQGRVISFLLLSPLGDGGQWDMLRNLVEKYGVVPKDAMPETAASSATRELTGYMTRKLREFACVLRTAYQAGENIEQLRQRKDGMMQLVYNMLCIALGTPPKTFAFETRNKEKEFIREEELTGKSFYEKYVGWNLSDYVSLINAPTADKPYHKTYTVKMLGNVKEGGAVHYLNLPIEELKEAAIRQMQAGEPVWFGCDVGQESLRDGGILAIGAVKADSLFGTTFGMSKAQRLDYGESLMTHAMVFQGVNLDADGNPLRWRVENSWGEDAGVKGYYVMGDSWFDEYTYQVVVNKKYLTARQLQELEQAPTQLEPWDPMGSLA